MIGRRLLMGLLTIAAPAGAQTTPPYDLPALIECRGTTVQDYNGLAFALSGDEGEETREALGLTEEKSGNSMLAQFKLREPLTVFGRQTRHVAFNSAGVFALLDEADPRPLAAQLGAKPEVDRPGKFMAQKVLSETHEEIEESGMKLHTTVSLNVSTLDSHPGKVLAGCGYRMDTE